MEGVEEGLTSWKLMVILFKLKDKNRITLYNRRILYLYSRVLCSNPERDTRYAEGFLRFSQFLQAGDATVFRLARKATSNQIHYLSVIQPLQSKNWVGEATACAPFVSALADGGVRVWWNTVSAKAPVQIMSPSILSLATSTKPFKSEIPNASLSIGRGKILKQRHIYSS
jgi:hypothetical protein